MSHQLIFSIATHPNLVFLYYSTQNPSHDGNLCHDNNTFSIVWNYVIKVCEVQNSTPFPISWWTPKFHKMRSGAGGGGCQRSYLTKIDFNFIFEKVPIIHKTYTKFGIFQIGTFYGMLLVSKQRSYLHSASFK